MMWVLFSAWMMVESETLWTQANQAYAAENYEQAVDLYEQLLTQGVHNGKIHYNLGNAYFKAGKLGPALLNYYRAERMLPGDQDLRYNLDLANEQRQDPVIDGEREGLEVALDKVFFGISYTGLFWLTLGMVSLAGLAFIPWVLGKKRRLWGYLSVIPGVFGLMLMALVFYQHHRLTQRDAVVVMVNQVNVLAGPSPREAINFTLHEGIRCQILEEQPGWFRIRLANGYNGWLPQSDVERI